uniref:Uncharacterized protein n=1 Tax=Arundo donax TaxID=35708 RepID=A0A0A8ZE94_ARUDO
MFGLKNDSIRHGLKDGVVRHFSRSGSIHANVACRSTTRDVLVTDDVVSQWQPNSNTGSVLGSDDAPTDPRR